MPRKHDDAPVLPQLDPIIQERERFRILVFLASTRETVDFATVRRATGLSNGNLFGHLLKLEEAALVEVRREIVGRKMSAYVSLTSSGWARLLDHRRTLESLLDLLPAAS